MSEPILLADTIQRIKNRNSSLISPEQNGSRKLSLGLLSPPSSSSSRSSSSASASVAFESTRYITVPTDLESPAAFEFLGFTTERALHLYERMREKEFEAKASIDIISFARQWMRHSCDSALDSTDDWSLIMTNAGINSHIRDAFIAPEHQKIRLIQPLTHWLTEILETNYNALVNMNERILEQLDPTPKLRGGMLEPAQEVPEAPGGTLRLFKSVEFNRSVGCIIQDGSVDLGRLRSQSQTDFCRLAGGLYFTHQRWVAIHYSRLIEDACPLADRRTIEIHVPLEHFRAVNTWELNFENPEYKQLVFYSRRNERYPRELSKRRAGYGVISGPVAHNHNLHYGKMKDWNEITEKHLLQEADGNQEGESYLKVAMQHVWIREEVIEQLEEVLKDNKIFVTKPSRGFKLVPQPWNDASVKDE
ncbi:hypothetical protein N0V83_004332 [Neocucurbitaria cava]|uniref:Uncharacterized protein n=1 Tax=Neocucurbitaria cava TaxID=798079 RepID=A0A9W9CMW6_9PLEO|nr:hypothetical protein N0V83_004332 [Neocucurbitaria cava]